MKIKGVAIYRSIVMDHPNIKAAEQAKRELERFGE
jgi:hypothetical protein